jgi:acetyl-CoA C-acetyltransferase
MTVYVVDGYRTAIGAFQGQLAAMPASRLGSAVLHRLWQTHPALQPATGEVIMGSVLTGGQGQAPARQAAKFAGLPDAIGALTINKVCGSGLKAVILGVQAIQCGSAEAVLAGGMESMSQAPFILPRQLGKFGHQTMLDSVLHDGLWDPYHQHAMGIAGEKCAHAYQFSREQQDEFAIRSYQRAQHATQIGLFGAEIVALETRQGKQQITIQQDEEPFKNDLSRFGTLKPAFDPENGTITAGNASKLNDGAAAVWLASEHAIKHNDITPKARILGYHTHSQEPEWFTTAPVGAINGLLRKLDLTIEQFASIEVNEAFAVVPLYAQRELGITDEQLNPRGGAIALGHPIGASGARLLVTLMHTLQPGHKGLACLCIGGGEAIALAIEAV